MFGRRNVGPLELDFHIAYSNRLHLLSSSRGNSSSNGLKLNELEWITSKSKKLEQRLFILVHFLRDGDVDKLCWIPFCQAKVYNVAFQLLDCIKKSLMILTGVSLDCNHHNSERSCPPIKRWNCHWTTFLNDPKRMKKSL